MGRERTQVSASAGLLCWSSAWVQAAAVTGAEQSTAAEAVSFASDVLLYGCLVCGCNSVSIASFLLPRSTSRHLSTIAGHILRNLGLDRGHQVILFPDTSVHTHLKSTPVSWGPNLDPTSQVGLRSGRCDLNKINYSSFKQQLLLCSISQVPDQQPCCIHEPIEQSTWPELASTRLLLICCLAAVGGCLQDPGLPQQAPPAVPCHHTRGILTSRQRHTRKQCTDRPGAASRPGGLAATAAALCSAGPAATAAAAGAWRTSTAAAACKQCETAGSSCGQLGDSSSCCSGGRTSSSTASSIAASDGVPAAHSS